jgi:hypothetical protein
MDNLLSPFRKYRICEYLDDIVVGATDEKSNKDITKKLVKQLIKNGVQCREIKMLI